LRDRADAEIAAPERLPRWIEEFRQPLTGCLDDGEVLLASAATQLAISTRTLQRLLSGRAQPGGPRWTRHGASGRRGCWPRV
jgi:hypothetical protein